CEIEIPRQITQYRRILTHVWARVGTTIGRRIEASSAEKIVFDKFYVGIEAEDLMIDEARFCIGCDDHRGHSEAVTVFVNFRRHHMVVEPAPVVPAEKDRTTVPVRALHHRVNQARDVRLAGANRSWRMLADLL